MLRISTANGVDCSRVGASSILSCIDTTPWVSGEKSALYNLFRTWLVRNAVRGRWCSTTNKTYQSNQCEYIRQRLEQVSQIGIAAQVLQGKAKAITQSKYEASHSSSQGSIFTKNHSSQGDKTPTICHPRVEDARNT